jgi:hypothetical protein
LRTFARCSARISLSDFLLTIFVSFVFPYPSNLIIG